jgi:catechol 2,3-dioxygenase-like lactoylglutathione lyase family enzyme
VSDLERSLTFYRDGLGLATKGIVGQEFEYGAVAFLNLQNGLMLALWPRSSIARDSGLEEQPPSATEFTLGHNVNSKAEVDEVMDQARRAGGIIVKAAGETFGAATPATFRIRMATCGKSRGILRSRLLIEAHTWSLCEFPVARPLAE